MYYKINGVEVKPSAINITTENNPLYGETTGRDEAGNMHLDLVRAKTRKYQIEHSMLTQSQLDGILNRLNPRGFSFQAPSSMGGATIQAYAGPPSYPVQATVNGQVYYQLSFSVIEL